MSGAWVVFLSKPNMKAAMAVALWSEVDGDEAEEFAEKARRAATAEVTGPDGLKVWVEFVKWGDSML
jgi:hypothetical protein